MLMLKNIHKNVNNLMSVNIEQVTRYFESKLYVLMHDPPDKAWLIINGINHVNRAKELYQRLFQGTPFGGGVPNLESDMRIIKSDKLASSFDRWIFLKPSRSNYVYKRIRLLNIFNPSYSYEIPPMTTTVLLMRFENTSRI